MKRHVLLLFAALLMAVGVKAQGIIDVSPTSLSDFSYIENEVPSVTDTFVVSASGLIITNMLNATDTLLITASEYYEISIQPDDGFGNLIRLYADANGTVEGTPVYVQMIEGLSVGVYPGAIHVSSKYGTAQDVIVSCSGTVIMPTLPAPVLSLEGNTYEGAQELEITCGIEGTSIKYRTSLLEDWQDFTSPILIDRDMTICAKATKEGFFDSEEVCANYSIEYTITVIADSELGEVEGGGTYHYGDIVPLIATPNNCYEFSSWSNGEANSSIVITVTGHDTIQAYFEGVNYQITAVTNEGGTVDGGGTYQFPNSTTITALPNDGYAFDFWTENGEVVYEEPEYTVSGCDSRVLEAHFVRAVLPTIESNPLAPDPICAGDALLLPDEPEVQYADSKGWLISQDTTFAISVAYTDQILDETYNNWWLTYTASNEVGTTYSEPVAISVYPIVDDDVIVPVVGMKNGDIIEHILVYPKAGYCYQWYLNDVALPDTAQYIYNGNGLLSGVYRVEIGRSRDADGQLRCPVSSLEYEVKLSGKSVYPNPSFVGETVFIVNDDNEEAMLTIHSIDGRLLHSQTIVGNHVSLSLSLPRGIYVACLTNREGSKTEKIVIQ